MDFLEKVKNLKREWKRPAKWNRKERELLDEDTLESMAEASEADWVLLSKFMAYRKRDGEDYLQPKQRWFFVQAFDDVLADAMRWQEKKSWSATKIAEPRRPEPILNQRPDISEYTEELAAYKAEAGIELSDQQIADDLAEWKKFQSYLLSNTGGAGHGINVPIL